MTKRIILIAEKPSVAKAVAAWLSKETGNPARGTGTYIEVGEYKVSWLIGHVLENVKPEVYNAAYKKWDLSDLPIIPKKWRLEPKEQYSKQINALVKLLETATEVIGLGDPDQEGQLLQDEFLRWAGSTAPEKRLWLSAVDDASIAKAWKAMKPNSEYQGYYWSALARSHADWLTGINLSRACTISSQNNGGNAVLPIGRVQTPTLALIVQREKEINEFSPIKFFTPFVEVTTTPAFKAAWSPDKDTDDRLDSQGRLTNEAIAKKIAADCKRKGTATVVGLKSTKGRELAPLPFSLSSLQELMSKKYAMGVQDVLKVAQSLYEKKVATYPRTDSEYLPVSQFTEAKTIIDSIQEASNTLKKAAEKADSTTQNRAFNDKKVSAHHAIVPRPVSRAQLVSLSPEERKVWGEIAKRYLLQFFPAAEILNTEIELMCADEPFKVSGKVYLSRGWKDAFNETEEEEEGADPVAALPKLKEGQELKLKSTGYDTSVTKPPKRFTEGTLVLAMKNIHRFVTDPDLKKTLRENVGIGTEATRANVIGELFSRKFIVLNKKEIKPTEMGTKLINALPSEITAPDITAVWQQAMDEIRKTEEDGYNKFINEQADWLKKTVKEVPVWFKGKFIVDEKKPAPTATGGTVSKHKCLKCKGSLKLLKGRFGDFFLCQNEACKETFSSGPSGPYKKTKNPDITIGGYSSNDTCPKCKKGTLNTRICSATSKTPGKKFLACGHCDHTLWSS